MPITFFNKHTSYFEIDDQLILIQAVICCSHGYLKISSLIVICRRSTDLDVDADIAA